MRVEGFVQRKSRRRGNALIEFSLCVPWLFFLFVGASDLGFFCYDLVAVQDAARVAALYTSQSSSTASDSTGACTYVLKELQDIPNVKSLATCTASPLTVTATAVTASDGKPASQASVTYASPQLIPIPGVLSGQYTWTRSVTMALQN
jgi:Flp pilus assembly protein TadG